MVSARTAAVLCVPWYLPLVLILGTGGALSLPYPPPTLTLDHQSSLAKPQGTVLGLLAAKMPFVLLGMGTPNFRIHSKPHSTPGEESFGFSGACVLLGVGSKDGLGSVWEGGLVG